MNIISLITSRLPRSLPRGTAEFETFVDRIYDITGPVADKKSVRFVLADFMLRLSPDKEGNAKSSLPDKYFVDHVFMATSKQVAAYVFEDIKNQQKAEQKALADAAKAAEEAKLQAEKDALAVSITEKSQQALVEPQAADLSRGKQTQPAAVTAPGAIPANGQQQ